MKIANKGEEKSLILLSILAIYPFHVPCFTLMAKQASELPWELSRKINFQFRLIPLWSSQDTLRCFEPEQLLTWQQLKRKKVIREFQDTLMLSKLLQCHFPLKLYIYYAYVSVCLYMHVWMCNGASVDQNENMSWILHFHHVNPGHRCRTSGLVASAFTHWAISLTPAISYEQTVLSYWKLRSALRLNHYIAQ